MAVTVMPSHTEIIPESEFYAPSRQDPKPGQVWAQRVLDEFYLDIVTPTGGTVLTAYLTETEARAIASAWGLI